MSCSAAGGSLPSAAFISGRLAIISAMRRNMAWLPNIIITGTAAVARAGVTSVIWISTLICGQRLLSTWPTICFSMAGSEPTTVLVVLFTLQRTWGTRAGTRPSTSRENSSTISGLRCFHQVLAEVTRLPLLSRSTSGQSGKGLALASSMLA